MLGTIGLQMEQSDDLEELKALNSKITLQMVKQDPLGGGSIKYKLNNKIAKLQRQLALAEHQSNIPSEIMDIAKSISQGSFDHESAMQSVLTQARKKLGNGSSSRFSLTLEEQVNQVLIQLRGLLENNAEQYPVSNPKQAIQDLCSLDEARPELAIRCVTTNLCARGGFRAAKQLCGDYAALYKGSPRIQDIRNLDREVSIAEISSITKDYLSTQNSPEDDHTFLEYLENELRTKGIKKSAILLKKGQDGTRSITLEDICSDTKDNIYR